MLVADVDPWNGRPACSDEDPDLFYPPAADVEDLVLQEEARRLCLTCEVRVPCLIRALKTDATDGIWGGTTPQERQRLRRRLEITRHIARPAQDGDRSPARSGSPASTT